MTLIPYVQVGADFKKSSFKLDVRYEKVYIMFSEVVSFMLGLLKPKRPSNLIFNVIFI